MPTAVEDLKRATHVLRVLSKHGLGSLIRKAGLTWHLHLFDRHRPLRGLPEDLPKRLTDALEELGGAYIKLGQLLSIRPDLIPPEYCQEFSRLQDSVEPESFETIVETIEQQFHKPINELFTHVDIRPLGSASIAQVHKARLRSGKAVVVKVQRPDVRQKFEEDIDILKYLSRKFEKHIADHIDPMQIIEEFEKYTKQELDFKIEGANVDLLRATTNKIPHIVIPKVFWEYTTKKVLTMDFLDGVKISDIKQKNLRTQVAERLIDSTLTQVFERGIFHADLHPGNILLLRNNDIGLLDFGIVGRVDKRTIELGVKLYQAIIARDEYDIADIILEYGRPVHETDLDKFREDIRDTVDKWYVSRSGITRLLYQLFLTCSYNKIRLPRNTVLLGKALVTAEGTAKQLDPDFDFIKYSQEKVINILKQQRTPKKMLDEFLKKSNQMSYVLSNLPKESLELIQTIKRGKATLELDDSKFRRIGFNITHSSNRLSFALIAASFIIAGSGLHEVPPFAGGYSIPVIIMYFIAIIFIILLISSIAREPRLRKRIGGA
jgi:ubiquinone biosynthesis protein